MLNCKGCYVHRTHPPAKFAEWKKIWRLSPPFSSYHPRTYEFIDKIKLLGIKFDEQVGLKLIVNTIQQADISPFKRLMLTRLINKSLYIGQPAHEYQTVTKRVLLTDTAKLTPAHCTYHAYANPHDSSIDATYEHLMNTYYGIVRKHSTSGTSQNKLYHNLDLLLIYCFSIKLL